MQQHRQSPGDIEQEFKALEIKIGEALKESESSSNSRVRRIDEIDKLDDKLKIIFLSFLKDKKGFERDYDFLYRCNGIIRNLKDKLQPYLGPTPEIIVSILKVFVVNTELGLELEKKFRTTFSLFLEDKCFYEEYFNYYHSFISRRYDDITKYFKSEMDSIDITPRISRDLKIIDGFLSMVMEFTNFASEFTLIDSDKRGEVFSNFFAAKHAISLLASSIRIEDYNLGSLLQYYVVVISLPDENFKAKRKKYEEFVGKVVVTQRDKFIKKDVPSDADEDSRIIYEAYNYVLDHISEKSPSMSKHTGDKKYEFITLGIWLIDLFAIKRYYKKSGFYESYKIKNIRYPTQRSGETVRRKRLCKLEFIRRFAITIDSSLSEDWFGQNIDVGAFIKYEEEEKLKRISGDSKFENGAVMSDKRDTSASTEYRVNPLKRIIGDVESTALNSGSEKQKNNISYNSIFLVLLLITGIVASLSLYTSINVLALLAIPVVYHSFISNAGLGLAVLSSVMLVFKAGLKPNKSGPVIAAPGALNSIDVKKGVPIGKTPNNRGCNPKSGQSYAPV